MGGRVLGKAIGVSRGASNGVVDSPNHLSFYRSNDFILRYVEVVVGEGIIGIFFFRGFFWVKLHVRRFCLYFLGANAFLTSSMANVLASQALV